MEYSIMNIYRGLFGRWDRLSAVHWHVVRGSDFRQNARRISTGHKIYPTKVYNM